MNRRRFLSTLVGGVAVSAAARTWPFRVFSFPSEIKTPQIEAVEDEVWVRHGRNMYQFHDGSDMGRGSGSTWMRVRPTDDIARLVQQGFRPAGKSRYVLITPTSPFKNLDIITPIVALRSEAA